VALEALAGGREAAIRDPLRFLAAAGERLAVRFRP
jgi:hypothetical protein